MKNFQPGGLRNRKPDLGGRPFSDASNYAPKKRFDGNKGQTNGNRPNFQNDRDKKDVQLFTTNCTTCGKSCEVPFRPDGKKPVLCKDCFAAKNESPTNSAGNRDRFTPNEIAGRKYEQPTQSRPTISPDYALLVKQLAVVETKVNQILELIKVSEKLVEALPVIGTKAVTLEKTPESLTKIRKPKKVTPAIKKAAVKKKVAKKAATVKKIAKAKIVK